MTYLSLYLVTQFEYVRLLAEIQIIKAGDMVVITEMLMMMMIMLMLILRRHWSGDTSGACRVPGCSGVTPGTLQHLATGECPGLSGATQQATAHWADFVISHPHLLPLLKGAAGGEKEAFLSFLLDPTTQPTVLALVQTHGQEVIDQVCMLTRTWLYFQHRARFRALGLWDALI